MPFADLRAGYTPDDPIEIGDLPEGTSTISVEGSDGSARSAAAKFGRVEVGPLPAGTYTVEAVDRSGAVLGSELTTVAVPGDRPVAAFVSSFDGEDQAEITDWLRSLRATSVQFYDWMASYAHPLGDGPRWHDPLGRLVSRSSLTELIGAVRAQGATAQAYAPVYAVDPGVAARHPEWLLYDDQGHPHGLGDLLTIADPGSTSWQAHWLTAYGEAAGALGFDGFHLDTYGYPRTPLDQGGRLVDITASYRSFLAAVRRRHPRAVVSFNQVNGVPRSFDLSPGPGYRYLEVWPPNRQWRHFEGLVQRSRRCIESLATLAVYPPVWDGPAPDALRTVVLTEAVVTVVGAGALMYGDASGVLRHPYYPDYHRMTSEQRAVVLSWHRFALRCRDLFIGGEDTSWTELDDENGSVAVVAEAEVSPEPVGGHLYTRVVRHAERDLVAVSLIDLTGSRSGLWADGTGPGRVSSATVDVHVDHPDAWHVDAAVLGNGGGRFRGAPARVVAHRQGRALSVEVPMGEGWSVLRLRRDP